MLKIRIIAAEVFSRGITSKKTGTAYVFREQVGVLQVGGDSQPCKVSLRDDRPAYPVGLYEVADSSFYVDRDGKLAVGRLELRLLTDASGNAASSPAAVIAQRKLG
jgi:hypothetical protein